LPQPQRPARAHLRAIRARQPGAAVGAAGNRAADAAAGRIDDERARPGAALRRRRRAGAVARALAGGAGRRPGAARPRFRRHRVRAAPVRRVAGRAPDSVAPAAVRHDHRGDGRLSAGDPCIGRRRARVGTPVRARGARPRRGRGDRGAGVRARSRAGAGARLSVAAAGTRPAAAAAGRVPWRRRRAAGAGPDRAGRRRRAGRAGRRRTRNRQLVEEGLWPFSTRRVRHLSVPGHARSARCRVRSAAGHSGPASTGPFSTSRRQLCRDELSAHDERASTGGALADGMTMRPQKQAGGLPTLPDGSHWPAKLLHGAPALLTYLDAEQRFRYVNETHRSWLGLDPAEMIGRRLIDVVGADNYERARAALEQAYAGRPASYEGELHANGERRYAHGNFQPDFDAAGRVCGVFTALVDITERHQLELQLHESERRFFSAFQHAAIGMALTGPDGRFLRVNTAVCQMLGYEEEELLRLCIADVTHPDDMAADAELMMQLLTGQRENYQLEKRNLHRDGHVVHIQLSVSLVRDDDGAPLYFVSQAQDISQRKAFEDALHRERELAEVTLRSIGDAVITTDPQLRISSLNPIAEAMTGWSSEEAQGRPVEEVFRLFDAAHGEPVANPLHVAIGQNTIVDLAGRTLLRHRHGFDTPVEGSCAPIHDHAGNVIGGVLVFHDVSETRALALKMIHLTQHDTLTGL